MDISEAYKFLLRPKDLEKQIRKKQLQVAELRSCFFPGAIRYDLDRVQISPSDRMSEIEARIGELEEKIRDLALLRARSVIDVCEAIDAIGSRDEEIVLMEFYIARKSMREISKQIACSKSKTYQIRDAGVDRIFKSLEKMDKMEKMDK